jgi:hypothetical protein
MEQVVETGVKDDAHHPPPPPAPDETSSKKLLMLLFDEDTPMTIATHMKGHRFMPFHMATTMDAPAATVLVAPKFPPELLLATEEQLTVVSGIGEDTPPTDTSIKLPEVIPPSKLNNPRLERFLATLDNAWNTNPSRMPR